MPESAPQQTAADQILVDNMLRLVRQHKETCPGPECGISLYMVKQVVRRAGLSLTDEEEEEFH